MPTTLSKGYKVPNTGESMPTWCQAITDSITQTNSHAHNGTDGELIHIKHITKATGTISSGSWVATSGGTYRQLVTVPSGYTVDVAEIKFTDASGNPLLLTVEKASSTTYYVYINDNTLTLTATYG